MADPAPPPLFVLAAPFSGASWLAGVLGQHPQLYALPQIFPFMAESVGELLDVFSLSQIGHGDGLRRAVGELLYGGQGEPEIVAADQWLNEHRHWRSQQLIEALAAAAAPRRLVIPDAEMPLRPHELRRLRAALPQAQWLHLIRHPWLQGCRFAAWLREQLFVPVDFRDQAQTPALPEPQLPWLRANRNLDAAGGEWPAGQVLRLSSESLDADFGAAVDELCAALGLSLDTADLRAMSQPQDWLFAQTPTGPARGGLEAEVWAEFSDELEALAAAARLDQPLPWRKDGAGFAPEVIGLAQRYGYR